MLPLRRKEDPIKVAADGLLSTVAARSRAPEFYAAFHVPDTVEGRFEMLALHAWLVLRRLKAAGGDKLAQRFVDAIFRYLDDGLRESGVGDLSMSRRMRGIAGNFYGRMRAYEAALADGRESLAGSIRRNVLSDVSRDAAVLTDYALHAEAALALIPEDDIRRGVLTFPPVIDANA